MQVQTCEVQHDNLEREPCDSGHLGSISIIARLKASSTYDTPHLLHPGLHTSQLLEPPWLPHQSWRERRSTGCLREDRLHVCMYVWMISQVRVTQ